MIYIPKTTVSCYEYAEHIYLGVFNFDNHAQLYADILNTLNPQDGDAFPVSVVWNGKHYETELYAMTDYTGELAFGIGNWDLLDAAESGSVSLEALWGDPFFISISKYDPMEFSAGVITYEGEGPNTFYVTVMSNADDGNDEYIAVSKEKTVIVPEGQYYTGDSYDFPVSITYAEAKELYEKGAEVTVLLNGVTYKCKPWYCDGSMTGKVYGFGSGYWAEADNMGGADVPDNGEPFDFTVYPAKWDYAEYWQAWFDYEKFGGSSVTLSVYAETVTGSEKCIPLTYIESTGTQYIDTGFKPNNNTRTVMDFELSQSSNKVDAYGYFGARGEKGNENYYGFFKAKTQTYDLYWQFAELYSSIWPITNINTFAVRRKIDADGPSATIDGVTKTYSARTFQSLYSMYLFASNEHGAAGYPGLMKLYSCQLYDNGTLIRDFIPCKTESGAVGLFDKVESKFYGNAGTGAFLAGPEILPPAPADLLMGWLLGRRIAELRKEL